MLLNFSIVLLLFLAKQAEATCSTQILANIPFAPTYAATTVAQNGNGTCPSRPFATTAQLMTPSNALCASITETFSNANLSSAIFLETVCETVATQQYCANQFVHLSPFTFSGLPPLVNPYLIHHVNVAMTGTLTYNCLTVTNGVCGSASPLPKVQPYRYQQTAISSYNAPVITPPTCQYGVNPGPHQYVFYTFSENAYCIADLTSSGVGTVDTVMFVYNGNCATGTCLIGNDDISASDVASRVKFETMYGIPTIVGVGTFNLNSTGQMALNVQCINKENSCTNPMAVSLQGIDFIIGGVGTTTSGIFVVGNSEPYNGECGAVDTSYGWSWYSFETPERPADIYISLGTLNVKFVLFDDCERNPISLSEFVVCSGPTSVTPVGSTILRTSTTYRIGFYSQNVNTSFVFTLSTSAPTTLREWIVVEGDSLTFQSCDMTLRLPFIDNSTSPAAPKNITNMAQFVGVGANYLFEPWQTSFVSLSNGYELEVCVTVQKFYNLDCYGNAPAVGWQLTIQDNNFSSPIGTSVTFCGPTISASFQNYTIGTCFGDGSNIADGAWLEVSCRAVEKSKGCENPTQIDFFGKISFTVYEGTAHNAIFKLGDSYPFNNECEFANSSSAWAWFSFETAAFPLDYNFDFDGEDVTVAIIHTCSNLDTVVSCQKGTQLRFSSTLFEFSTLYRVAIYIQTATPNLIFNFKALAPGVFHSELTIMQPDQFFQTSTCGQILRLPLIDSSTSNLIPTDITNMAQYFALLFFT